VEANVNAEGEPGLDAGVPEAEDRVHLAGVQGQAFALAVGDRPLGGAPVLGDRKGPARIDAFEHADPAGFAMVAGGDRPGDVLLAVWGGVAVADFAAALAGPA
jgi:hypothetical protein